MLKKFLINFLTPMIHCMIPTYVALVTFYMIPNWLAGDIKQWIWAVILYMLACTVSVAYVVWHDKERTLFIVPSIEMGILMVILYIVLVIGGEMVFNWCFSCYYDFVVMGGSSFRLPFYFVFIPGGKVFGTTGLVHALVVVWYVITSNINK